MKSIEEYVRSIPDFPEPGIIFRDVTSVLQDAEGLHLAIDLLQKKLEGVDFDLVVGPESGDLFSAFPSPTTCTNLLSPSVRRESFPVRRFLSSMIWSTAPRSWRCTGIR